VVVLVVVLLLVLAACGVLVGSVLTNHPQWAWFSVLLSVLGAALLVVERARRRREASSSATESAAANGGEGPAEPHSADSVAAQDPTEAETTDAGTTDAATADAATESLGDPVGPQRAAVSSEPGEEPEEEDTDAADWLVVSELDSEVVVLDERPRYHLRSCGWLGERTVVRLPVREARELGFTPCALCVPDATLARRARAAH
jgi:hypothetical protein